VSDRRHEGRRVLVTGAANGIGRAVTLRFLDEGASVAGIDIEAAALAQLETDASAGERLLALHADVNDEQALADAVSSASVAWGGLDVVVANAAIEPISRDALLHELDGDVLRHIVDVNLVGMALTCKYGVRALLSSGGGSVICTASPTGLFGVAPDEAGYSISKSGAVGITRVLAAGYAGQGIRANAVIPGFTDTRMNKPVFEDEQLLTDILRTIPLGRAGTPDEVASVIAYLASDEASYVTGAIWAVDGGMTAV
jgi:NAD(P)-dependent dehydrogenase (short-subunit alcohol dehydrogenase family)